MVADRFHLIRHGEVLNPNGVVYGRLPGFALSDRGRRQALDAGQWLHASGAEVRSLVTSPLERARDSGVPVAEAFGVAPTIDSDLIEASSHLEGRAYDVSASIVFHPEAWRFLVNPLRPSWGEPYREVQARMSRAIEKAITSVDHGDVVFVSHQMPIWVTARAAAGRPLAHDPRARRCGHSSVTTFDVRGADWVEVGYRAVSDV